MTIEQYYEIIEDVDDYIKDLDPDIVDYYGPVHLVFGLKSGLRFDTPIDCVDNIILTEETGLIHVLEQRPSSRIRALNFGIEDLESVELYDERELT